MGGVRAPVAAEGKVEVKEGAIHTGVGMPFSGISWAGDFPTQNFEVEI